MKADMSAAAVTLRLKHVSQLRRLCLALGKAKVTANSSIADPNGYEAGSSRTFEGSLSHDTVPVRSRTP